MKKAFLLFGSFIILQSTQAFDLSRMRNFKKPLQATSFIEFASLGITVAGGNGQGSAANQLQFPGGIAVDQAGNVYIADGENNRVQKWSPGATSGVTVAGGNGYGSASNQLRTTQDVSVDLAGNVYVLDGFNSRVQKWAPGAVAGVTVAGGNGQGLAPNQLSYPTSLFLDLAGNMYITDFFNNRVQKWAPGASAGSTVAGGNGAGSAPNQLSTPNSVFVDAAGNIYVLDQDNNRIQKWAPGATSGITVIQSNGAGTAPDQFLASDIYVDQAGNIYLTDAVGNRVQKWAPGATSGISITSGYFVGIGADQFNYPSGITFDQSGNMYVADSRNQRVQKFLADQTSSCPPDLFFTVPFCNGTTPINWKVRNDTFPATIDVPEELSLDRGRLNYMGALDGHGYYKSSIAYTWPVARDISFYIGDTSVNGHLLTIGSLAENNFIYNLIKGSGYSPWIGLYNTGKPNRFAWVDGAPVGYTNWAPNEPNNAGGNERFIKEPYVRLQSGNGSWNDQRSENVPFIAEFDQPLIRYRQISGPANGSAQGTGVYRICYEIFNTTTDKKDTCCFNVTVTCATTLTNTSSSTVSINNVMTSEAGGGLNITMSPNPSSSYFKLKISSGHPEKMVDVVVTDALGKVVESRRGVSPGQTLAIGAKYRSGIYFAQVIQGSEKIMVKIVKQ